MVPALFSASGFITSFDDSITHTIFWQFWKKGHKDDPKEQLTCCDKEDLYNQQKEINNKLSYESFFKLYDRVEKLEMKPEQLDKGQVMQPIIKVKEPKKEHENLNLQK